ncbi:probable cytochrome P450 305a1 [Episyrphus balteatus]|uniref:probable cytochrome P450 305a1 n=1 Tax=Episyrphus balteatus TaxID=286459 RepID=UPI002484E98D|nr:probable cytochrome P450 305a1 [Episyrphus balteatus]
MDAIFIIGLLTTIILIIIQSIIKSLKRPDNYPPGPAFQPWVGNTVQLRREAPKVGGQHFLFKKWAKEYKSNVIGLKLGGDYVIVVSSYPLVKQVHLSEVFEGRPDNFFLRLRTMGTRKGITSTDGPLWNEHRNFAMKQMKNIGYGRTPMEAHIIEEADDLIQYIDQLNENPVWPGSFLATSVINVLWFLTTAQHLKRTDERLKTLLSLMSRRSKLFDMCGGVLTQFPWLRHIAPDRTGYNLILELNKELSKFIMDSIDEHKANFEKSKGKEDTDLIYAYLKEMSSENTEENGTFDESQLTMIILDFFIAGSQTTSNTLDLALMILAIRADIQEKVFKEIQENLDEKEFPLLTLKKRLPYVNALIMEVQRYFHIVPISGPRRALWDTEIGGYKIPKNTTVLISAHSVLMDESHWKDPQTFRPERFLDYDEGVINDEYFIPFGQGRRRCPGDLLARSCLFSFLCKILQNYKIESHSGSNICTTLQPGMVLTPKPYTIIFRRRS